MEHDSDAARRSLGGLTRRAALLAPLAAGLGGCSIFDDLFFSDKPKVPGTRIAVNAARRGLQVDPGGPQRITLPPPVNTADWPQPGGSPTHVAGHQAVPDVIAQAWRTNIGEGGGYRRKITALPVIAGGRVHTMDSDGVINAYLVTNGSRIWQTETQGERDRSTNVGGGIAIDGSTLYASTGRAEVLALELATGKIRWRKPLPTAARAAPTVADGAIFVPTLDDEMVAFKTEDGTRLWAYQALNAATTVLGLPSPAVANGFVIGGFTAGDLVALGAVTGGVSWSDSLASARGRNSLVDVSSIRGMPVVAGNQVIAIGLGGTMLALDLRSGRRLWEREVGSAETPCVAGDWIFIVSTEQQVAAISRLDGRVAWVTQLDQFDDPEKQRDPIIWTGPLLAGDRLILGGSNAQALAVSPYTGKILGTQKLSGKASVAPVAAGGTVYMITDDGNMIALR